MVSSVQNSLGSTAYLKGSNLGNAPKQTDFSKQLDQSAPSADSATVREPEKAEKTETNDNRSKDTSQLEARNDQETLQTEQTRGSLLDIAV